MAKDVIQLVDKETGETGNVRDSRLALAKEKTAVALTDAIELRTIDDKQIFVKADSFFNAFAQWCKANNKSTITSLFGELTADGVSSPGSINMANLASVLSGQQSLLTNILGGLLSIRLEYNLTINNLTGNWIVLRVNAPDWVNYYYHELAFGMNQLPSNDRPYLYIRRCDGGLKGWEPIIQ